MIFGALPFLYLLPLAGLPILFHLILKQKKRTVVFSTLMFFHRVDPKLNTRRRIREWLLLALRVLLIALLLLALSRPTFRSAVGRGGKLSLVAVIDNSGSMSAGSTHGDRTKLECAKEGARKLLSSLEPDAEAAVVLLVEDSAGAVPESLSADRAGLLKCLDRINPTEATGDAHRALSRAFDLLHGSAAGGGAVHVFTDLQQAEWTENRGEGASPLRVAGILPANRGQEARDTKSKAGTAAPPLEVGADRIRVYFHKIGTAPPAHANVAVTGIELPQQRILAGQPYQVGLSLRNTSDAPAEIRINSLDSQARKSTQNLSLQKQEIATVRLPITVNEQGYHWLKAWIEGDGFPADNTAGIGLFCEGTGTVLFLGQPREFGMLPVALCPSGRGQLTGLITEFTSSLDNVAHADSPGTAGPHGLKPILLVTTWDHLAGVNPPEITKYIEEGGNLLVVPSLSPGAGAAPAWLGAGLRTREAYQSGVRLAILSRDAPFWRQIEQGVGDLGAEPLAAYAFCPLDVPAGFTPLLGVGTKKVILAHQLLGEGHLFVSGLAFSPRWSTLPLSGLGVVMVQRMAVAGSSTDRAHVLPLVAGERPSGLPGEGETQLLSLCGAALEWKGPAGEMPPFPRTGVYLATAGDVKSCISVRASPKEGEYRFVDGANVPALGSISHTVVPFDPQADYAQYHADQARVRELYIPLLLLATLAAFIEGLLGAARVRARGASCAGPSSESLRGKGIHDLPFRLPRLWPLGRRV